jgi:hypothetical protein
MLWTSVLSGENGFLRCDESQHLIVDAIRLNSNAEDFFWKNLQINPAAGLLFIDLVNRRRLRVNGSMIAKGGHWGMTIEQAYPNCPNIFNAAKC